MRRDRNRQGSARRGGVLLLSILVVQAVVSLTAAAPAIAQRRGNEEAGFQRRLQEADRNLRRGNTGRARRIYEELLGGRPENDEAFLGLVSARIAAYDLEGLDLVIRERLATRPGNAPLVLALGEVSAASGDREGALATWRGALPLFDSREEAYMRIARRMEKQRMLLEAIDFLLEGRAGAGGRFLYAGELCRLYGLVGEGKGAAREWVRAAAEGSRKASEALRKIRELKEEEEIGEYPYGEMKAVLDSLPFLRGVREIRADCLVSDRRCDEAFLEYRELEKTEVRCGTYLMPFARSGEGKGCAGAAAKAAEEMARRCDRPTVRLEARFLLARIHRGSGEGSKAAEIYREILEETKNPVERNRARFELASVLIEDLGDGAAAIPVLRELLGHKGFERAAEARFALARAFLIDGKLEEARDEYDRLFMTALDDATRERALFGKGRALFFIGLFDDALAEYRRVIDQFPNGRYLNDAITQSIFLFDHRDAGDGALKEYADALLLVERRDYGEARKRFESMFETLLVSKLRGDLVWQLALIEEAEGRYKKAVETLDRLVEEFPEERLAHDASIRAASLFCTRIGDLPEGVARYERFLVDYPESILTGEARRMKKEAELAGKL